MIRRILTLLCIALTLAGPAGAQNAIWPQTLPGNSLVGRLGAGLPGPAEALPFANIGPYFGTGIASIAALKALPGGAAATAQVVSYYLGLNTGGGLFRWNATSTAADNACTVIAPTGSVTAGRWIRLLPADGSLSPDMCGAYHDGSHDDAPFADAAAAALSAAGGGTLAFGPFTYNLCSISANGVSAIRLFSGVNVKLNGATLKHCNNLNAASATAVGSGSGTNLTVSSVSGTVTVGALVNGAGIPAFTTIVSQTSGTTGGAGVYVTSGATTASSASLVFVKQFVYTLYNTNTLNHVTIEGPGTIDANGANNSCSGTCFAPNTLIGAQIGTDLVIRNVRFINNPGSNDIVIGTNVNPPVFNSVVLTGNLHEHSGYIVNPASLDFSADFVVAASVVSSDNRYRDGPAYPGNGSAFEYHGTGITATNLVVDSYLSCGIVANELASPATSNINVGNVKCSNVYSGIQVASRAGATETNVSIHDITINHVAGNQGYGIDACSLIDAATGANTNLSISNVQIYSNVTTNLGNDAAGICIGRWLNANVTTSQTYNTQGPGIRFIATQAGAALSASGNQIYSPGHTSTVALQAGIVVDATPAVTSGPINIQNNEIGGVVLYPVIGGQNASGGLISGNPAPGATISGTPLWTGTGVTVAVPVPVGTSGGVPYYVADNAVATSAILPTNRIVLGGGAGGAPAAVGSNGSTTTVLHGAAGTGAPTFGAVANADLVNASTTVNGQTCTLGSTCTVTASASGAAGGDLTGTYPNPTLAGIISAGGPTGSATVAPIITYDAKGRLTAVSSATITPAVGSITGFGTGVGAALAINTGSAGAPVLFNGAGGTPSSINLSNATAGTLSTNTVLHFSSSNVTGIAAASTWFVGVGTLASAEIVAQIPISQAATLKNAYVSVSTAPAGVQTNIFTLRKNGADTTITCTITGAATTCNDTTHTVSVVAGDLLAWKDVTSATAAAGVSANAALTAVTTSP